MDRTRSSRRLPQLRDLFVIAALAGIGLTVQSAPSLGADPQLHEGDGDGDGDGDDITQPDDDPDFGEPTAGSSGE